MKILKTCQFAKIRSIQVDLSGFLYQVGLFIILVKLKLLHKVFIDESSSIPALKSSKKSKRSYLVVNKSKLLLNSAMWFDEEVFLGL